MIYFEAHFNNAWPCNLTNSREIETRNDGQVERDDLPKNLSLFALFVSLSNLQQFSFLWELLAIKMALVKANCISYY